MGSGLLGVGLDSRKSADLQLSSLFGQCMTPLKIL